ncbi:MAG: biotin-dependent carboxyltransferase family protein [Rudaea sp.]
MSIEILAPGWQTSVQDGGRHGHAALGVGASGAMDCVALRLANWLVGNADTAAALEITLRGPTLRFDADSLIALTGAPIPARCGADELPMWRSVRVRAGCELRLGTMPRGAYAYLAMGGGIDSAPVLGSRSADINAGLGGALVAGDVFPILASASGQNRDLWHMLGGRAHEANSDNRSVSPANWSLAPRAWFDTDPQRPLRVVEGAHFAQLDAASRRALFATAFRISGDSNRVGYRLDGAKLQLRAPLEIVSAGVAAGTVQLPPGGIPIALMAEAPTCGGYPRIAHVIAVDLPRLAQRRPGDSLRFEPVSLDEAQTRYLERERALISLARTIMERLHG